MQLLRAWQHGGSDCIMHWLLGDEMRSEEEDKARPRKMRTLFITEEDCATAESSDIIIDLDTQAEAGNKLQTLKQAYYDLLANLSNTYGI